MACGCRPSSSTTVERSPSVILNTGHGWSSSSRPRLRRHRRPRRHGCGPKLHRHAHRGPFSTTGRRFHHRCYRLLRRGRCRAPWRGQHFHRHRRGRCLRHRRLAPWRGQHLHRHPRRCLLCMHHHRRRCFSHRRSSLSWICRRPSLRLRRSGRWSPRGSPVRCKSCCRDGRSLGRTRPHRPLSCRSKPRPHRPLSCRSPGRTRPHRPLSCRSRPRRRFRRRRRNG
jgi:hypothetical protein